MKINDENQCALEVTLNKTNGHWSDKARNGQANIISHWKPSTFGHPGLCVIPQSHQTSSHYVSPNGLKLCANFLNVVQTYWTGYKLNELGRPEL